MCGLAGFVSFEPWDDPAPARARLHAMTRSITHRGPDAEGYWDDPSHGVALGHRRLSILDLSPSGAQPMQSRCGRYVIAFNGEIYNHLSLREELSHGSPDHVWNGHSDTETLLLSIAEWGLETALEKAYGMFALALWDRQTHVVSLARDRLGEKPLYFAQQGQECVFGSELRALLAAGIAPQIDQSALAEYLRYSYVPDHLCILKGVQKVMPGSIVELSEQAAPKHLRYDSIEAKFGETPDITDPDKSVVQLESVLENVVSDQMISDVPLGCFLSGGVDSSLVASLMQANSERQIRSFSIGFQDARYNEAPHAAAVARHLGTDHTEFTLKEEDALAAISDLPKIYDEPFADSSQIPTLLLCRSARSQVTVALTGDGGDEVFGGYNRHIRGPGLWNKIIRLPRAMRHIGAGAVNGAVRLGLRNDQMIRRASAALGLPLTTLENLPKLVAALRTAGSAEDFYQTLISTRQDLRKTLIDPVPDRGVDPRARDLSGLSMAEWLMVRDTTGYLPGDILVKVDRAAMSVSLETRAPFLDGRVINLARRIPTALHVDGQEGKKLLREVLDRHVPRSLIERPKQGFAIPLDDWLRGALQDWGANLILDQDLAEGLGMNATELADIWRRHQDRRVNAGRELWTLLMLLAWAREIGIVRSSRPALDMRHAEGPVQDALRSV